MIPGSHIFLSFFYSTCTSKGIECNYDAKGKLYVVSYEWHLISYFIWCYLTILTLSIFSMLLLLWRKDIYLQGCHLQHHRWLGLVHDCNVWCQWNNPQRTIQMWWDYHNITYSFNYNTKWSRYFSPNLLLQLFPNFSERSSIEHSEQYLWVEMHCTTPKSREAAPTTAVVAQIAPHLGSAVKIRGAIQHHTKGQIQLNAFVNRASTNESH